jgi:hypothetical protein
MNMMVWLMLGMIFWAQPSQEVIARFDADTYAPLTGQPFTLTLIVEAPPDIILTDWPTFESENRMWGRFEVQSVGEKIESARPDGGITTQQSFNVILWLPRDVVTPETFISYGLGGDETRRVPVREAFISVTSVVDPLAPELIPARPLVQVGFPVWIWGSVMVCVVVLIFGIRYCRRPKAISYPLSAAERAAKALTGVSLDITRPATDRLRDAVAILASYGREVSLSDDLAALIRAGEEAAYSGKPMNEGHIKGFITRGTALLMSEERNDG